MRKLLFAVMLCPMVAAAAVDRDFRGVWLSTLADARFAEDLSKKSADDALPNEDKAYGAVYEKVVNRILLWPELAPHETTCERGRCTWRLD